MIRRFLNICAISILFFSAACSQAGRDRINIVGSSTVFPFSSIVAEQFAAITGHPTPKVEATGTGGGIKIFCQGAGLETADIANASRKIKKSEFETCQKAGVQGIIEIKIGYDGIVIAHAKQGGEINLSRRDIYLAVAKNIMINGKSVPNPNKLWSQINPNLPNIKIDIMGPPPTSGTRDAFVELIMEKGALEIPELKALHDSDKEAFKKIASGVREDGVWKDMGENDNLIVQALVRSPESFGVFGFAFAQENRDRISTAKIDGIIPTVTDITDGKYSASRSLFFYVKKQNIEMIPGIKEFMTEFLSKRAAGRFGYLKTKGLIPLKDEELAFELKKAQNLEIMAKPEK